MSSWEIKPETFYKGNIPEQPPWKNQIESDIRNAQRPKWELYSLQSIAMQEIHSRQGEELKIFSRETKSNSGGSRYFVVCSYVNFWREYSKVTNSKHFYELIVEGTPCCLYFDVEFKIEHNPALDGIHSLGLFINYLKENVYNTFGTQISDEMIIDLDSSSKTKFSHHLIFKDCLFVNNVDMGSYVKYFISYLFNMLKAEHDQNSNTMMEGTFSNFEMLFPFSEEGQRIPMIDIGVYTRNRNFRLIGSSKVGKDEIFQVGSLNKFPQFENDPAAFFFASLVCYILPQHRLTIKHLSFESISNSLATSQLGSKLPNNFSSKKSSQSLHPVKTGGVGYGYGTPFPELDEWVLDQIQRWPGSSSPTLRSWRLIEAIGLLTFNVSDNRWCENVNREHKSNHITFNCDLRKRLFFQGCLDPQCRSSNFSGSKVPIPVSIHIDGYPPFQHLDFSIEEAMFAEYEGHSGKKGKQIAEFPTFYFRPDPTSVEPQLKIVENEYEIDDSWFHYELPNQ